jgi:hypothetical protein
MVKYSKNENFFTEPSVLNSYWAGFIAADGCISKNRLTIGLSSKDSIILERFKIDIGYNGKIYIVNQFDKRTQKTYTRNVIRISSKTIINDLLLNWNISERKSTILTHPNLSELKYQLAYIIGYIDGDGCISIAKAKDCNSTHLHLIIAGTESTLKWINSIENKIIDNQYNCSISKRKENCFVYDTTRQRAYKFLSLLKDFGMKNSLPILSRKWDKVT